MNNAKFCMHCGAELPQGAAFCPNCGGDLGHGESENDLDEEYVEEESEENEEDDMGAMFKVMCKWVIKPLIIGAIIGGVIFPVGYLVTHVYWGLNYNPFQLFLSNPPVEVSVRHGILSDSVVTVRNDSDKLLKVRVVLYKGQQGKYSLNVAKSGLTQIKPGETKEFGKLELEHGWGPTSGDKGFVCVEGYMRVVTFELYNGRYSHGYGFGIPDDAPMLIQVGGLQGLWRRD